jgi:hypothetical protein
MGLAKASRRATLFCMGARIGRTGLLGYSYVCIRIFVMHWLAMTGLMPTCIAVRARCDGFFKT